MTELDRNIELVRKELNIMKEKYCNPDTAGLKHINYCLVKIDIIQKQISEENKEFAENWYIAGYRMGERSPDMSIEEIKDDFNDEYNKDE